MKTKVIFKVAIYIFIPVVTMGCKKEIKNNSLEQSELYSGILHENMDTLVRPGDNFMNYVNGTWLRETKIPDDYSSYGVGYIVDEKVNDRIKQIVENCASGDYEKGSDEQMVGDLYASYININRRNTLGLSPLQRDLEKIDSVHSHDDLAAYFGFASRRSGRLPIQLNIWPDLKDSNKLNVYLSQHGLGLPEREYYLANDKKSKKLRDKYKQLIASTFEMAGILDPESSAETVLSIEGSLAEKQMKKEEAKLYTKLYNVYRTDQLNKLMPDFNWNNYLAEAGLQNRDSIVVEMVDYTKALNNILISTSIKDWKSYLKWCLMDSAGYSLSEEFESLFFNFYQKELYGYKSKPPLWKRAVNRVDRNLGQLIVKLYGQKHVSPKAIKEVEEMIQFVKLAFAEGIKELEWMGSETKEKATEKLHKLSSLVVYPKKWRDFSKLNIHQDDYYGNTQRLTLFTYDYYLSKLDKPLDKDDTEISLFSGSYDGSFNTFKIGATFLLPPYFDENAENAVNYGGIGSVIGHEMGHAFDNIGSSFDGDGNVVDWWTDSDKNAFNNMSEKLIAQFDQYIVLDSLSVNGKYTVSENMADLTSVVIPLKAYELSRSAKTGPKLDNFSALQRFLISYGQIWMFNPTEERLRNQIATDSHAPEHLRVNGIVRNVLEFYEAFDVKEGDSLYLAPKDRVKIW